jgi:hypothetical protein
MGILRRLLRDGYGGNDPAPDLAWDQLREGNEGAARETIEYDGTGYRCIVNTSENGEWTAAFGLAEDRSHQRLFLIRDGTLSATVELDRPKLCAVANDGTTLVASRGGFQEVGGEITLFDADGTRMLTHSCDSNIARVDITPDGTYGAASALKPDCKTYLFNCVEGELACVHENRQGNKQLTKFNKEHNDWHLYLSNKDRANPLYAIDMDGEISWKGDRFHEKPFSILAWLRARF